MPCHTKSHENIMQSHYNTVETIALIGYAIAYIYDECSSYLTLSDLSF